MASPNSTAPSSLGVQTPFNYGDIDLQRALGSEGVNMTTKEVVVNRLAEDALAMLRAERAANQAKRAMESPLSSQIQEFTKSFFEAITPKTAGGLTFCALTGCMSVAAFFLSAGFAVPSAFALVHLGLARVVKRIETGRI